MKIYLSKDLDDKFRRIAMTVYGYGRGSISRAAEEALTKWCNAREPPTSEVNTSAEHSDVSRRQDNKISSRVNPDERPDIIVTDTTDEETLPSDSKNSS